MAKDQVPALQSQLGLSNYTDNMQNKSAADTGYIYDFDYSWSFPLFCIVIF